MTTRFANLFKKTDLDEQKAFQRKVHAILSSQYQDRIFTLPDDPQTIESDGRIFGLTNLRSNFLLTSQTEQDLRDLTGTQFDSVLSQTEYFDREGPDWDEAKGRLMPQLMPAEFLEKFELVHFPFGDDVVLGFVIDTEAAYSYVRQENLSAWDLDAEIIRSAALANLSERSKGIEMTVFPGDSGLFVVNTMDGFDAVRLVDRELQELVGEHIGSPFYAGIPNRDFLICWSKNDDREFQDRMRTQVSSDFDERPYPLSRKAFQVGEDGEIELAVFSGPDPRALSAESN